MTTVQAGRGVAGALRVLHLVFVIHMRCRVGCAWNDAAQPVLEHRSPSEPKRPAVRPDTGVSPWTDLWNWSVARCPTSYMPTTH